MRIVKLDIDEENIFAGLDAVALVELPAIEEDFMYFSEQKMAETFNDYPKAAVEAAKQGIKRNKENNNKCATQVGKVRAQQLANGESLSLDTIRRMRSFLIRQKDNYELQRDRKNYDACGYISYLLWGGEAALPWAEKKLRQAGEEFADLDDACQPGYEAIGLKTKNGRKVPNCVPKKKFTHEELEGLIIEDIVKKELNDGCNCNGDMDFSLVSAIDGIPVYSTIEEAEAKAKEIGCEGYHEHTTAEGLKVYMPCSHHGKALDSIQDNAQREFDVDASGLPNFTNELPEEVQDGILNKMEEVGETMEGWTEIDKDEFFAFAIKSTKDKASVSDYGKIAVRYRYKGPQDSRNRDFCSKVLRLGLVFRKEDINNMSITNANKEFGVYDIFRYKGSYNCRHRWQEVFYKRDEKVSDQKRPTAISDRILDGTTYNLPVIQKNGVADREIFAAYEDLDEKQILVGPLMKANKLIKRVDEDGEYFVYFDADTIEKLAYKFMEEKLIDRVNIEHDSSDMVNDAFLVESWIVKDPKNDKSAFYGYEPKKGDWYGMYKIKDKAIWDEYIRTGKVKGFSVEGYFNDKIISHGRNT